MDTQLLAFVTVAEEENFTRAADKLHISQPAVSQHIQNLEQKLDCKLLDRTNKYVRLNRAGEIAYRHAKEILRLYGSMQQLIQDLKGSAGGPLHIGASYTFGEYILPHLIARFNILYPKVDTAVSIGNTRAVLQQVAGGELDLGIIEGMSQYEPEVEVVPFAEDVVAVVAAHDHPLFGRGAVTAEELEKERWIIREIGSGTREVTDQVFRMYGIHPRSISSFSSTQVIKESVEAGLGITVLSQWAIRKELHWNTLRTVPLGDRPITRKFSYVLRKSQFQTKATALFRDLLQRNAEQIDRFETRFL